MMQHPFLYRTMLSAGVILVLAIALVACPCPTNREPFNVVYPVTTQDWNINDENQIVMTVRFNRDVDFSSLAPGENVLFSSSKVYFAELTIEPGDYGDEIIITTEETISDLLDSSGNFTLTLKGDGPSPVRANDGLPLDGDYSGEMGGDFVHHFLLVT